MMSPFQRIQLRTLSLLLIVAAAAIVLWAGLPDRAMYTGQNLGSIGRVAPELGAIAPPFELETTSGETLSLLDTRGDAVIVNFWATWCLPCRAEMPELQSLHDDGLATIIGINIGEPPEIVNGWVRDLNLTFAIVLDPENHVYADYRIRAQPTTFVINGNGIITHIFYGATTAAELEAALQSHG